jgi:hypothetical protein
MRTYIPQFIEGKILDIPNKSASILISNGEFLEAHHVRTT